MSEMCSQRTGNSPYRRNSSARRSERSRTAETTTTVAVEDTTSTTAPAETTTTAAPETTTTEAEAELEGVLTQSEGLGQVPQRVDAELRGVQDGLEEGVVEGDGLPVALEGLFVLSLERGDVAEQVVRLG